MERPQTAAISNAAPARLEQTGTAWHGAIAATSVDPALAQRFQQLVSERTPNGWQTC